VGRVPRQTIGRRGESGTERTTTNRATAQTAEEKRI